MPRFATPQAAQAAFYAAFNALDHAAMMQVWSTRRDVVCIHPGRLPLLGLSAIESSWRSIMAAAAYIRITVHDHESWQRDDMFGCVVTERIRTAASGENESDGVVVATNLFRREGGDWRMILHHGAPCAEIPAAPPAGAVH
jgi:ketosteroid isomerase-like protein